MTILKRVLLVGAVMLGSVAAAQAQTAAATTVTPFGKVYGDVAFTFSAEHAKYSAPSSCGCFWLLGGTADASVTLYKGLGLAASVSGLQTMGDLPTGQGLNKVTYLAGPRYTYETTRLTGRKHRVSMFGEGLFGKAHGTNSLFPTPTGTVTQQTVFAMQAGVGLNVALYKGLGVRVIEADYVYTQFTNDAQNVQKDFMVSSGLSYRFGK